MRSTKLSIAIAITLAMVSGAAFASDLVKRKGWRVMATPHSYEELNKRLDESIKKNKMGLVNQASATVGAKSRGVTIPGNRVVGVFRPDFAIRMLKASLAAGIEAPIRFYVTENPDGKATLSYRTPSAVFEPYMTKSNADLRKMSLELNMIFEQIAKDAAAP
jgi:uncharacterized protein (DUF302 family)